MARVSATPTPESKEDNLIDPVSARGQRARGAYITGPYLHYKGVEGVVRLLRRARLDAAVIDLKDGRGRVTYETAVEVLKPQVQAFIEDPQDALQRFRNEGIYTIARLVCFADPALAVRVPERAIVDNRPGRKGQPWRSWGTAGAWLDPFNRANHDMIVALAREAEALGFDEIQLDYIRFPVDDGIQFAEFPADDGRSRDEVLLELLGRIDRAVRIPLGVDVFGLTAFDFDGGKSTAVLGQNLEMWSKHVEVYTPMLYLNSMRAWGRGMDNRAYRLIRAGISNVRERLGDTPVLRPFLQSFAKGTDDYTPGFIVDQILGARDGAADGFLFWHPGSNYEMLLRGMATTQGRRLESFDIQPRARARQASWKTRLASRQKPRM